MGMAVVLTIVVNVIITVVLLTAFLYYYNMAFQCDAYPSMPCFTTWKCPGYAPDSDTVVLVDSLGRGVTNRMMNCYLSMLYGKNGADGKGNNEYGEPCQYKEKLDGTPGDLMTVRAYNTLADTGDSDNPVSAGCNADGGVKIDSANNWLGARPGAYQNIYSTPGKSSSGQPPFYPCSVPDGKTCVTVSQLLTNSSSSNNGGNNFFTNKIGSCIDTT